MRRREATRTIRRALTSLGLTGLLALAVLGLTRCRMVEDRITGVDLRTPQSLSARSECVHRCNQAYQRCRRSEDGLHQKALQSCGTGSPSSREACVRAEVVRHHDAQQDCAEQMRNCKDSCYDEGGGTAGD